MMMMQQIQELQKTVRQLQTGGGGGGGYGQDPGDTGPGTHGMSSYRSGGGGTWSNNKRDATGEDVVIREEEQTVLLVSNIPPNLANPDSLFYAFEKFGTVTKIKILHNKRNTALIQMSEPAEAHRAIQEQETLNRVGTDIYVNYSSKMTDIRMPEPGSRYDDGLAKDFTGQFSSLAMQSNDQFRGNNYGGGMMGAGGMMGGGGMFNNGGFMGEGGYDDHTPGARGPQSAGLVLLVSNLPEEIANVDNIFNMIGMYGDVMFVKILRNKRDCCMVQMSKPHHAQQVKTNLDGAKVGGNKLCISYSRVENLLNKRIPEDDELQKEFLNSRNHRYRSHAVAAKLQKNLGPPTSTLHVANLPDGFTHSDIKVV